MFTIYILIVLTIIVKLSPIDSHSVQPIEQPSSHFSNDSIECLIENKRYKYEFLRSTSIQINHRNIDRNIYAGSNIYSIRSHTFIYPLRLLKNYDLIKWRLKLASKKRKDVFFLTNSNSDEYLCATNSYADYFIKNRRVLATLRVKDDSALNTLIQCKWKFEHLDSDSNVFSIWNAFYKEPLYAASFFFKKDQYERSVFLWSKNDTIIENGLSEKASEFKWKVTCVASDGEFQII